MGGESATLSSQRLAWRSPAEIKSKAPARAPMVVLVIDDLEYGGAQRQAIELANNLNSERFEVHICSLSSYLPLAVTLEDRHRRLHVISKLARLDLTVVPRLAWLLRRLRADIVHSFLFSADIASRLAGRLARTPVVISSERSSNHTISRRNLLACRLTRSCVDYVIANSRAGAAFHLRTRGHQASQYRVVYNGVDTRRFAPRDGASVREELGIAPDERLVGMFASFKPKKNHSLFYIAAQKLLKRMDRVRLLMVGDELAGSGEESNTYRERLARLVDDLGIRERCLFLGNRNDVARLYCACHVTVLPSLAEGLPNVLLESMACGVPVVATDVSDNARIAPDGRVGYIVPLNAPAIMAESIGRLLVNDSLRRKFARAARQWASSEFSIQRLAENTAAVYAECLAAREGRRG